MVSLSETGSGSAARDATLKELSEAHERLDAANIARQWAPAGKEDEAEARFAVAKAGYDDALAKYKALPEEADAWKVGDAVRAAYGRGSAAPPKS